MARTTYIIRDGIVSTLPFQVLRKGKPLHLPTSPECKVVAGMTVERVAASCAAARQARIQRYKTV